MRASGQRFDVFLSYNSRDREIVERIAERLKRAGFEPWLDRWSLTPGGDWQRELGAGLDASVACAVFVGAHDLGAWELQEVAVAIDRAATQQGFRVFPVLLPDVEEPFDPNRLPHFLRARTWVDLRRGIRDSRGLQDLINAIKGVPFGPEVPVVADGGVAPYPGLQVFGEEDAAFFFGRDREVQRLLESSRPARSWRCSSRLVGSRRDVSSLAYSADGRILASGSKDGTMTLWDPASPEAVRDGRLRQIDTVAFDPDSGVLALGGTSRKDNTNALSFVDLARHRTVHHLPCGKLADPQPRSPLWAVSGACERTQFLAVADPARRKGRRFVTVLRPRKEYPRRFFSEGARFSPGRPPDRRTRAAVQERTTRRWQAPAL